MVDDELPAPVRRQRPRGQVQDRREEGAARAQRRPVTGEQSAIILVDDLDAGFGRAFLPKEFEVYGVPIVDEIERRTGRSVSRAAVYVTLRRLEQKGLLSSFMSEPTAERFFLTRSGIYPCRYKQNC